jgi:hypothetical protein
MGGVQREDPVRALLWIVLAAAALWSGLWAVAARSAREAAAAFVASPAGTAWGAGYGALRVAGFPNRIDLTVTEPRLGRGGLAWRAPFLQVFALAYRPQHVILAFPPAQTLDTAAGSFRLAAGSLQASAVVAPGAGLPLERANLAGDTLSLARDGSLRLAAASLRAGLRRLPDRPAGYAVAAELAAPAVATAAGAGLPAAGERLFADLVLDFAAPLDAAALDRPPPLAAVTVTAAEIAWGPLRVAAAGALAPDAAGFAAGRLTVTVADWPAVRAAAQAAGLIGPAGAAALDARAGSGGRLEEELILQGGHVRLGPVPLGPAPRWP